jgi:hypothetical protein
MALLCLEIWRSQGVARAAQDRGARDCSDQGEHEGDYVPAANSHVPQSSDTPARS